MPRALKYYCGCIHVRLKDFPHHHNQRHVYVIASSRKRVQELLAPYDRLSASYIAVYYSCVPSPPVQMQDKPCEEGVWIEPLHGKPVMKLTPEMVV